MDHQPTEAEHQYQQQAILLEIVIATRLESELCYTVAVFSSDA